MRRVRGDEVALIPQDPMTSLNPTMTIGRQICRGGAAPPGRQPPDRPATRALEVLRQVEMPQPDGAARPVPPRALRADSASG